MYKTSFSDLAKTLKINGQCSNDNSPIVWAKVTSFYYEVHARVKNILRLKQSIKIILNYYIRFDQTLRIGR